MQISRIVRWQNFTISLMLTGICLILGSYSQKFYIQWDMTTQARHSLTRESKAIVKLLDHPVRILTIMGPNKTQRMAVKNLVEKYQTQKPDISLEFLNPETSPARVRTLKANTNGEVIIYYGDEEQRIHSLSERILSNALRRLAQPTVRRVLFVSGHQERKPLGHKNSDYYELLSRLADTGFSFGEISLVTQPIIPEDTNLLVIAGPIDKYFPGEVASILNYLGRGGSLLWLRESGSTNTELNALDIELGISPLPGRIVEANSQLFNIDSPTFVVVNQYPANPVTVDFNSITLFPEAIGLNVLPMQEQTIRPLLRSSDNSWTELGEIEGQIKFDENTRETRGPVLLGITIDRERSNGNQRIAVIGDADFMANTWLGNGGNRTFSERLFNWLTADEHMVDLSSMVAPDREISIGNTTVLVMASVFLILLPLILFFLAFLNWRTRKNG